MVFTNFDLLQRQEETCSYGRSLKKRHKKTAADQTSVIDGLRTLFAIFFFSLTRCVAYRWAMLKVVGASWLQTRISSYILVAVALFGIGAIVFGEYGQWVGTNSLIFLWQSQVVKSTLFNVLNNNRCIYDVLLQIPRLRNSNCRKLHPL